MNINTRDLSFVNFNGQEMQYIKYNNLLVWEAWEELLASGILPLTLNKCKGVDLVDYKIYGESVQASDNLFDKTTMLSGFLPQSGAYPTTNSEYPNASYQIIDIKAGQTFKITYSGSNEGHGRIRYIDNDTNLVIGPVNPIDNDYFVTTQGYNNGFKAGEITAKKDFKLGVMYIMPLPTDFDLQIVSIAPTPEAPIEIESVGDKTKNLWEFDFKEFNVDSKSETYTFKEPITTNCTFFYRNNNYDASGNIYFMYFIKKSGGVYVYPNHIKQNSIFTIGATEENPLLKVQIRNGGSSYISGGSIDNFMLVEGTYTIDTMPDFEPYGYKIPIKVSGKNLLDIENVTLKKWRLDSNKFIFLEDNSYLVNYSISNKQINYSTANVPYCGLYFELESQPYERVFSISTDSNVSRAVQVWSTDGSTRYATSSNDSVVIPANTDCLCAIRIDATGNYIIKDIQIGNNATEYEPYIEPITTNIYLDEPLRKIKNYADYIDFEKKKVVRKINKHVITNNSNWAFSDNTTEYNLYRQYVQITDKTSMIVGSRVPGLCNVLISNKGNWNYWVDETAHFGQSNNAIYFITKNKYSTATEIYNYLSNNGENEVYVLYPPATPTEEPIELPNIPTHKGTTILSVDTKIQPSNAEVIYVGKP